MSQQYKTWAKMYWRTNPKIDHNQLSCKIVEFVGRDEHDIKQQLNYHIGKYGIVRCELAQPGDVDENTSND